MRENFYSNGPVKVAPGAFIEYRDAKDRGWDSFDRMFYDWIDEKNPDDLRRLLIRDMLRQSYSSDQSDVDVCHRTTFDGFGRILHVGGSDKEDTLYWTLFNRPKLLAEIVGEFLYNLEHNLVPLESMGEKSRVELIEFLMKLASAKDTRELLFYHPIRQGGLNSEDMIDYLFRLWAPQTKMPGWLRDELWLEIEEQVRLEIATNRDAMIENGSVNFPKRSEIKTPAIQRMQRFIGRQMYATGKNNFDAVIPCLWLLEKELPGGVNYHFGLDKMASLAARLTDKNLALEFARRLMAVTSDDEIQSWGREGGASYLYWLYGLITMLDPDDEELSYRIKKILSAT